MRQVFVEKRPGFDIEARRQRDDIAAFLGPRCPALARLTELRILNRYTLSGPALTDEQFARAVSLVFSEPQCDQVLYELPIKKGGAPPYAPNPAGFPLPPQRGSQDRLSAPQRPTSMSLSDAPSPHAAFFGVEYLPGQYDQRADSAEQCLELVLGIRPRVRCAKFYILVPGGGAEIGADALAAVKNYLINPVDSREAADLAGTEDAADAAIPDVPSLTGFTAMDAAALELFAAGYGLAMSREDLAFCREHFAREGRDPTLTELRVLDTYWSDHCRHTTFTTILESIGIVPDEAAPERAGKLRAALELYEKARAEMYTTSAAPVPARPRTLMDLATIGAKVLKKRGLLPDLDESEEINACTIKVKAKFAPEMPDCCPAGGAPETEDWLLLFKNETHNHPTEIEPFGGAATCLGGAIRDPLSGRAFVHQAMRVSGGGDPRVLLEAALPGKLPQLKIAREAAAGYSSYGNQIGLATGQVAEFYHPGYIAKRLELGAVIAAAPQSRVRRAEPEAGDMVLLIGGATGRDGIGGATGSSKAHSGVSVETAGAEVQKGNAVEERKLQRLFRSAAVCALVKRCNDFGAGGVSVAVGELAPGLDITLDALPKKYAGLDGTELAISESQERMAVVAAPADAPALIAAAAAENLAAVVIATVTAGAADEKAAVRLRMNWRGAIIVDLPRSFLDSNGAARSAAALITPPRLPGDSAKFPSPSSLLDALIAELFSLRSGSRRGLQERFDGTVGAASVLFPFGGAEQGTPECGMAALLPAAPGRRCLSASLMCFGFDPALTAADPYAGAKGAVKEALAKFACLGGDPWAARLSMQEYFERMESPESWGRAASALLGALEAQLALGVPAIGGKDSMSGSYRDPAHGVDIAVPPGFVVFAAGTADAAAVRCGALSGRPGNAVILFYDDGNGRKKMTTDHADRTDKRTSFQSKRPCSPCGQWSKNADAAMPDEWARFRANMDVVAALTARGLVRAAYPVAAGGAAAALALMAFGNMTGVEARADALTLLDETNYPGAVLLELDGAALAADGAGSEGGDPAATAVETVRALLAEQAPHTAVDARWTLAAHTIAEPVFRADGEEKPLEELRRAWESALCRVYPQTTGGGVGEGEESGFWEKIERIKASEPVKITGKEISEETDVDLFKKAALKYGIAQKNKQASYKNLDKGWEIGISRGTIKEIISHDHNLEHYRSIAAIPEIIQKSIYVTEKPNEDVQKHRNIQKYEYYMCGLVIGAVDYTVKSVVAVERGRRYYDHKLTEIEKGRLLSDVQGITPAQRGKQISLSNIKDKRLLNILQEEFVKIPNVPKPDTTPPARRPSAAPSKARPLVVLPVFPGTNGEYDMEQAFLLAGARTRQVLFRNRSARDIAESTEELAAAIAEAQIVALSGGFSAGDEPDGSGKFIANVLRAPAVADALSALLERRGGLVLGICNGFQALIKLGLVPYGRFAEAAPGSPTLTFNRIGRHVSRMARTVVMSNASPWLALEEPGAVHVLPVSHGEGRFVISEAEAKALFEAGQVAACYADKTGRPALAEPDNPNGSDFAIEAITSPDGRVLGKMGHSERRGEFVHINIPGNKNQRIFEAGIRYFTG